MTLDVGTGSGSGLGSGSGDSFNIQSATGSGSNVVHIDYSSSKRLFRDALKGVHIYLNGDDVTKYLIEYQREQQICTGMQLGTVKLIDAGFTVDPWDEIVIYEYDVKVVTFIIAKIERIATEKSITFEVQDYSKRMADFLIDEVIDLTDFDFVENPDAKYVMYWIGHFLEMGGINYRFEVIDIVTRISTNTSLGMQMLYDQIQSLLQMVGWFCYFDEDGVCVISSLLIKKSYSGYNHILDDGHLLQLNTKLDDSQLRNWALVWGNSNPMYPLVFVSLKRGTSWQRDLDDWRVVVISNHSIYSRGEAFRIAKNILDTFSTAVKKKEATFVNDPGIRLGNIIYFKSMIYYGKGRVTTVGATCGEKGLVHNIITDERCPRLFAYIGTPPEPLPPNPVKFLAKRSGIEVKPNPRVDDSFILRSSALTGTGTIVNMATL